jgi:hypothetical protein
MLSGDAAGLFSKELDVPGSRMFHNRTIRLHSEGAHLHKNGRYLKPNTGYRMRDTRYKRRMQVTDDRFNEANSHGPYASKLFNGERETDNHEDIDLKADGGG